MVHEKLFKQYFIYFQVFPAFHAAPFSKMLTFYRKEPFSVSAYYSDQVPYPDTFIGMFI